MENDQNDQHQDLPILGKSLDLLEKELLGQEQNNYRQKEKTSRLASDFSTVILHAK